MHAHEDNAPGIVGDEPPIMGSGKRRAPDRREISLRWLGGTFLTGLTSTALMGVALLAALDGKQLLATPPELVTAAAAALRTETDSTKSARIVGAAVDLPRKATDRRRMSVSTVTRQGDSDVVRTRPFEHLSLALAKAQPGVGDYPPFNPLTIFAEEEDAVEVAEIGNQSLIYGANVETEASIRVVDFVFGEDVAPANTPDGLEISTAEAEEILRGTAPILVDGAVEIASLHYVDPLRFGVDDPLLGGITAGASVARVVPQNVSVTPLPTESVGEQFSEALVDVAETSSIDAVMRQTGHAGAADMAHALATLLKSDTMRAGHTIRLGLRQQDGTQTVVRASVYQSANHLLTIALNDQDQFVPAPEPVDPGIMQYRGRPEETAVLPPPRDLPTVYDAIYRSVLAYDLPQTLARQIIRMVAAEVDFHAQIRPGDSLELFYSVPEEGEDQARDVLFVQANFAGQVHKFYKFRSADGSQDYFDEEGRSARQFLLRNPVPTGTFRSAYGMRRHPILGYSRMHWGVDWSAPHGTPIIAPGNGEVIKAGWSSGYGKQTVIRHANGYETSYSHQTRFAKGVVPGARVRQGQVIGYIGTTGLSTGPHLHYEMKVNGKHVDPMRVRLPGGKSLEGEELEAFKRERDRINALLEKPVDDGTEVASASR